MKVKDKRRYTRKPLKIEARYQDSNRKVLKGTVRNISIGGVYVETPHTLERGDIIRMTLDAVDVGRVIDVEGKVVRCEPEKGMGIEFVDQDNREIKKLISTMRKLDQASLLALSRSAFDTDL
jgi:Tfp pilus assembly protein PilZ